MRLGDMKSDDKPVPAEVEAELDALDAALRGEEVPAGMEGLEALVSDLRAEKPEPEPRFEAELDDWAAAGFPRGERPGAKACRRRIGRRLVRLLLALRRRRLARLGAGCGDRRDARGDRRLDHARWATSAATRAMSSARRALRTAQTSGEAAMEESLEDLGGAEAEAGGGSADDASELGPESAREQLQRRRRRSRADLLESADGRDIRDLYSGATPGRTQPRPRRSLPHRRQPRPGEAPRGSRRRAEPRCAR